ncbi:hypothetical protein M885DRAFT_616598 [Pelagophyceae sp. CCMP2097]|nr:hypothetical protein M885DRAFT_616598 [Pelagophyceae sp. CCMP2097]|mmetsp:Transcript_11226/g.37457  ORF Transcript_11226/g.37457 Transcript_11226/m.37457 type:complete len:548 (+) Transcript_11226:51-1694(+)
MVDRGRAWHAAEAAAFAAVECVVSRCLYEVDAKALRAADLEVCFAACAAVHQIWLAVGVDTIAHDDDDEAFVPDLEPAAYAIDVAARRRLPTRVKRSLATSTFMRSGASLTLPSPRSVQSVRSRQSSFLRQSRGDLSDRVSERGSFTIDEAPASARRGSLGTISKAHSVAIMPEPEPDDEDDETTYLRQQLSMEEARVARLLAVRAGVEALKAAELEGVQKMAELELELKGQPHTFDSEGNVILISQDHAVPAADALYAIVDAGDGKSKRRAFSKVSSVKKFEEKKKRAKPPKTEVSFFIASDEASGAVMTMELSAGVSASEGTVSRSGPPIPSDASHQSRAQYTARAASRALREAAPPVGLLRGVSSVAETGLPKPISQAPEPMRLEPPWTKSMPPPAVVGAGPTFISRRRSSLGDDASEITIATIASVTGTVDGFAGARRAPVDAGPPLSRVHSPDENLALVTASSWGQRAMAPQPPTVARLPRKPAHRHKARALNVALLSGPRVRPVARKFVASDDPAAAPQPPARRGRALPLVSNLARPLPVL